MNENNEIEIHCCHVAVVSSVTSRGVTAACMAVSPGRTGDPGTCDVRELIISASFMVDPHDLYSVITPQRNCVLSKYYLLTAEPSSDSFE